MTNLLETFEMKIEQKEDGKVVVSMPVTDKVKQPFGYLHGGASLALGGNSMFDRCCSFD